MLGKSAKRSSVKPVNTNKTMNAFIPENPRAVVMVNDDGDVVRTSSNIGSDFRVEVVHTDASFNSLSAGLPFDSARPPGVPQVLAHKKN